MIFAIKFFIYSISLIILAVKNDEEVITVFFN